jgi:hypothetical protein
MTDLPSVSEAHQESRVTEKPPLGMQPYSLRGPNADDALPSSFYPDVVANRVQAQIPDEPVEAGRMSGHLSLGSTLPPYSPGEFRHDEDAPPLPGQ